MNKHIFWDTLAVNMGRLYGDKIKFFREESSVIPIGQIIKSLDMEFTPPTAEGEYHVPVRWKGREGIARYTLLHKGKPGSPTLIFHHGSGETSYAKGIKKIFPRGIRKGFTLLAVSIPSNRNMGEYIKGIRSLESFGFLLASSVQLFQQLGLWARSRGSRKITGSGISLGGWVTNLHFSAFGSFDEYRPIFAGAALDELFLSSVYQNMGAQWAQSHPKEITEALNFEHLFPQKNRNRVFPLLARYDQYIEFDRQRSIYLPENVSVLEKGHITGAGDTRALRSHLTKGLA